MRARACMKTAREKVYIAKLEVVISAPNTLITHWLFFASEALAAKRAATSPPVSATFFAIHEVVLSDQRTPLSLASCSSVTGRKDPVHKLAKIQQNNFSITHPHHRQQKSQLQHCRHRILSVLDLLWGTNPRPHIAGVLRKAVPHLKDPFFDTTLRGLFWERLYWRVRWIDVKHL